MNRTVPFIALVAFALPVGAETVNFDTYPLGAVPPDWTCASHGTLNAANAKPDWKIIADPRAQSAPNVLIQQGSSGYAYCLKNGTSLADGTVEVKFRPIWGEQAQAAGIVFRFKDMDHYYVARANANESNINLYYFDKGRRMTAKKVDTPTIALNEWHTLKIDFHGKKIQVTMDGKLFIDVEDDHISGAGPVGVWTRYDSKTAFDDFTY